MHLHPPSEQLDRHYASPCLAASVWYSVRALCLIPCLSHGSCLSGYASQMRLIAYHPWPTCLDLIRRFSLRAFVAPIQLDLLLLSTFRSALSLRTQVPDLLVCGPTSAGSHALREGLSLSLGMAACSSYSELAIERGSRFTCQALSPMAALPGMCGFPVTLFPAM